MKSVMKKKKGILSWWLLLALGLMILSGGCGGGGDDGGDGRYFPPDVPPGTTPDPNPTVPTDPTDPNPPSSGTDYPFSALEGTWTLVSGSGTANGNIAGYNASGSATAVSGTATISSIQDQGTGVANCNVRMTSEWSLNAGIYGTWPLYPEVGSGDPYEMKPIRKQGANVFIYDYTDSGSSFTGQGTMTITLTSATTASVNQKGGYSGFAAGGYSGQVEFNLNYTVRKQ